MFTSLDKNGDGVLTIEEINGALKEHGKANSGELESILRSLDTD